MSEYQYYEFQAIDRPLGEADLRLLRDLSTRARITTTSFTNSYDWGDFKGDPIELMRRWFDLHLYLANWGTRRLMIRFPSRLIDRNRLDEFFGGVDCAGLTVSDENLILDVVREEEAGYWEGDWGDGSGRLAALAPLRADVLAGDLRLFYLIWLTAVEADALEPGEKEPLPGIGPLTEALGAFADFFGIDPDLVAAAAERSAGVMAAASPGSDAIQQIVAALPEHEKTALLARLVEGDPHVAHALRALVRDRLTSESATPPLAARSVGELRSRADAIRRERERAEADRVAVEQARKAQEEERARRARLDAIMRRGDGVWREIETEIERRNAPGYERAIGLLLDLRVIAEERGTTEDFTRRLRAIRERHVKKERFIERLQACG
jgi:hypothetical protein